MAAAVKPTQTSGLIYCPSTPRTIPLILIPCVYSLPLSHVGADGREGTRTVPLRLSSPLETLGFSPKQWGNIVLKLQPAAPDKLLALWRKDNSSLKCKNFRMDWRDNKAGTGMKSNKTIHPMQTVTYKRNTLFISLSFLTFLIAQCFASLLLQQGVPLC